MNDATTLISDIDDNGIIVFTSLSPLRFRQYAAEQLSRRMLIHDFAHRDIAWPAGSPEFGMRIRNAIDCARDSLSRR